MSALPQVNDRQPAHLREVRIRDLVSYFVIPLPLFFLAVIGSHHCFRHMEAGRTAALIALGLVCYILLRRLCLGAILMYKAFAPMKIRGQCRFEPSCSTYALICFRRYGLILGFVLSLLRIQRCQPPHGGEDYPSLKHLLRLFGK